MIITGASIGAFFKRIPEWVLWAIGAVLFLKFVDFSAERRGREKQRDKDTAKTLETVREIEQESRNAADEALEARDSAPRPDTADGVPDDVAKRIFRD